VNGARNRAFSVPRTRPRFCHPDSAADGCKGPQRQRQPTGSYTRRVLDDPTLLASKLREGAGELAEARDPDHVAEEAADRLYFAAVALARAGKGWACVRTWAPAPASIRSARPL
jgi:phosphoribosyl-ATP pyrophosphohydrolase